MNTVSDIIRQAIDKHPIANGLCNRQNECGCGVDTGLYPCDGVLTDCELAEGRVLNPDEYMGDFMPGDMYYFAIGSE